MLKVFRGRWVPGASRFVFFTVLILTVFSTAADAAEGTDTTSLAMSFLVISFLLSVCILVVCGFSLWQSHRYYLDTVRLSREITATTTELHQKMVELIYNLKDFLAHESEVARIRGRRPAKSNSHTELKKVNEIVESISATESKIKALEKTLGKLHEQLDLNFHADDVNRKLSALSDIEYAVLLKLSQDPGFFEKHSFTSFGATPKVLDSLLSRQLIVFDKDGKAEVPREVAMTLEHSARGN